MRDARIGLGGVAAKPWRAHEAEAALRGQPLDEAAARRSRGGRVRAAPSIHGENGLQARARPPHPGARAARSAAAMEV